jgi:hypothetical protein
MALVESSNQYKYTGKGPLDKKALVATYAELLTWDTWVTKSGTKAAYNTMIVGVWANKTDSSKNGVYYLFDPACTSTIKNPDVTNPANWHKIAEATDLNANFEELASKVQILDVTVNGTEEQEGLVAKVAKNATDIADIKAAGQTKDCSQTKCKHIVTDVQPLRTFRGIIRGNRSGIEPHNIGYNAPLPV